MGALSGFKNYSKALLVIIRYRAIVEEKKTYRTLETTLQLERF
jgi:hypothetical protein